MSDTSQGPGWWQASDGKWYPPEQASGSAPQAQQAWQPGPGQPGFDPNQKSKLTAGLLGIFLGGFGVHRFYLGYTQIGIIQIVVTVLTCGIGSIWGLVEGIMILAEAEQFRTDAEGRPLRP